MIILRLETLSVRDCHLRVLRENNYGESNRHSNIEARIGPLMGSVQHKMAKWLPVWGIGLRSVSSQALSFSTFLTNQDKTEAKLFEVSQLRGYTIATLCSHAPGQQLLAGVCHWPTRRAAKQSKSESCVKIKF